MKNQKIGDEVFLYDKKVIPFMDTTQYAADGSRTHMVSRTILSRVRLPIPPQRLIMNIIGFTALFPCELVFILSQLFWMCKCFFLFRKNFYHFLSSKRFCKFSKCVCRIFYVNRVSQFVPKGMIWRFVPAERTDLVDTQLARISKGNQIISRNFYLDAFERNTSSNTARIRISPSAICCI